MTPLKRQAMRSLTIRLLLLLGPGKEKAARTPILKAIFVRTVMQTPWCLGLMGFVLVFVPVIGMWAIHNYGWEHWEPFSKHK